MRLELTRPNGHYPLKVARLPIPPLLHIILQKPQACPEQDSNLHVSQHSHLKRARLPFRHLGIVLERKTRLELATPTLARLCSTNWAISALVVTLRFCKLKFKFSKKERKTRLELATPTLARLCSTNWAISAFWKFSLQYRFPLPRLETLSFLRQGCALPTELFPRFC